MKFPFAAIATAFVFVLTAAGSGWAAGEERAPGAAAEASAGGEVIIPSIPGVPKIFLPDIGIAGDFAFERNDLSKSDPRFDPTQQQSRIRDGAVVFFSPIDPYTNAQFTIDLPAEGQANISEAWLSFNKLPGGVGIRLGRYAPQFGLFNPLATYQLPMADRPGAVSDYTGGGGMTGTGIAFDTYLPNPFGWNLKLNLNAVSADTLGATENSLDLTYLESLDYSRDIFTTGSMESGVSFAQGPSPVGRSEVLTEPYLQIQFAPTQRKILTWSTEAMLAERHGQGSENSKQGFYTFLDYNFALRYHVGFLVDVADRPVAPFERQVSWAPNASYFLSDNLRLRAQFTHTDPAGDLRTENKGTLQATFSLGNLKQLD